VLLQLVPRVVGQFVVQIQADVLLYPIAIHKTTSLAISYQPSAISSGS
jgi:hypothetical protein